MSVLLAMSAALAVCLVCLEIAMRVKMMAHAVIPSGYAMSLCQSNPDRKCMKRFYC
jgi:hypothetical protein